MNYPVWDVPIIGSGWVIGIIAIIHVLISHFAVGGGVYLAVAEWKARREGRVEWLGYLKQHSYFFLVLTGVYGAVTGVAIWFAIGLAHPEGTSSLIHNFVFGWAIEWVFFLVELTAAAVYYYTWDRIPAKTHQMVGWVYAIASILTLVIINGILTFMLTPGKNWLAVAGTGREADEFWYAFFNPTYWPSLIMRTAVCLAMAAIWGLVSASRIDGDEQAQLKTAIVRWSSMWLFPAFVLMPICFVWYLYSIPPERSGLLELGITTIGQGTFTQVTRAALVSVMTSATVLAIVYFVAYLRPTDFTLGHSLAVLAVALAATGSTEYSRELLRKPYVVADYMYSSGVRKSDVERMNREGYLTNSPWSQLTANHSVERGRLMFLGQCACCHTTNGYRSMKTLLGERDRKAIGNLLESLHNPGEDSPYRKFMPPLVGTSPEIASLGDYLLTINQSSTSEHR
ncbi:MAG: cytochrome ubiquinol oxidase subunit I [Gemmataceae bacterium]